MRRVFFDAGRMGFEALLRAIPGGGVAEWLKAAVC